MTFDQYQQKAAEKRECIFSHCRRYRYSLWRFWGDLFSGDQRFVAFICLNPSTADETTDDPTVRRCIGYASSWGYSWFCMLNLFAYRATDPKEMIRQIDPVGIDNDRVILEITKKADLVVCAWGNEGSYLDRDRAVIKLLANGKVNLHCLKMTTAGNPWHPLYLSANLLLLGCSPLHVFITQAGQKGSSKPATSAGRYSNDQPNLNELHQP